MTTRWVFRVLAMATLLGCGHRPHVTDNLGKGGNAGMSGAMGSGGTSGTGGAFSSGGEWNGVIGTGQSLAVGTTPVTSTTQPYGNLKLALGGTQVPPWDPNAAGLSLVPLVEPIHPEGSGFPRAYPGNVWGETPHSAMANEITALVKAASPDSGYVTVHTVVGESGQGIAALNKQSGDTTGMIGRAYAASIFEVTAIARLAAAAAKTYGISVIVMTHGETDSGSSTYKTDLIALLADYNTELSAITGQTQKIPMFLSQQFAYPQGADQRPLATLVQWQLGVEHPGEFVCTGPKYQYDANVAEPDGVHLSALGYQQLGEKTGQVYYERIVLGNDWQPLQPTSVERDGDLITVNFHVPVPPLAWDEALPEPMAWPNGKGFEVRQGNTKIAISSVEIAGDSVQITCAELPASGLTVGYAMTSGGAMMSTASHAFRWGKLKDSDPFVGSTTNGPQPNYCVAFEMAVP
jgi:hypothetical protein